MPKHDDLSSEPTSDVPETSSARAAVAPGPSRGSHRVAVIALAVAVIAGALAAWSLLRPVEENTATTPPANDKQTADAKARACAAYNTVHTAVALQTHLDGGQDPVAVQAVAANARLSMAGGGAYLLASLGPATPAPLAESIRTFADQLQGVAMNALAGVGNEDPAQAARLKDAETADKQIADLCK